MSHPRLRVKRLGDVFLGKMLQTEAKTPTDVAAPYLRAAHVQPHGRLIDVDDKTMWFGKSELEHHDLRVDDVVIVEGGAGFGRSAVVSKDRPGWGFQNSIVRVRPRSNIATGRFLNYAFQSALENGEIEVACFTATIPHFTAEKVGAFLVPAPPKEKQLAIANYLDRETARIDTLIEEQQLLIHLLRERRIAISEGQLLNSDWSVPLRAVTSLIQTGPFGSQLKSDEYIDEGVPVINPSHIIAGVVRPDVKVAVNKVKAEELARHALHIADIIAARRGELGRCAVVDEGSAGYLCGTGSVLIRLDGDRVDPYFFALVFSSRRNRDALSLASVGSTMDNLNADIIGALRVPVPKLDEQRRVVSSINGVTSKIDTLIEETKRFIELSKERRAALITAAVTGQIDVREVA